VSHRIPLPEPLSEWFPQITDAGMKWMNYVRAKSIDIRVETFTLNPDNLAANTHTEQTATVSGLKVGDHILSVKKPTHTAGYGIADGHYVSADDTLEIQVINPTGSGANPGSETWTVTYIKDTRG